MSDEPNDPRDPNDADDPNDPKAKLESTLDESEWSWLKPHAARDALIIVSRQLHLVEVGRRIAADDSKAVQGWIQSGELSKPTAEQLKEWETQPTKKFMSLIVAPYVLAQEILFH